jgi:hypothetical protein
MMYSKEQSLVLSDLELVFSGVRDGDDVEGREWAGHRAYSQLR